MIINLKTLWHQSLSLRRSTKKIPPIAPRANPAEVCVALFLKKALVDGVGPGNVGVAVGNKVGVGVGVGPKVGVG
ncbi:MAG: hypothetical protein V2I36_13920 [Desulfopila sp.]|jgi:hypothetical protein|nr:hypothetical protein [Desulfopila sp.]